MQNGDLRIISDDYYVVKAKHTNRALHRHEGYEAFYVISGECDHILVTANTEKTQRLSSGNFIVLDNTVSHRFKNGNSDFCVINFLFKHDFIFSDSNFLSMITDNNSFLNVMNFDSDKTFLPLFEKAYFVFKKNGQVNRELAKCYAKEIILQLIQGSDFKEKPRLGVSDKIATYAQEHFSEPITLSKICNELHYSLPYVSRKFKQDYLITFEKFLQNVRIEHACMLLLNTDMSINEIALAVSYSDTDAFRKIFSLKTGKNPTQFRLNHLNRE